MSDITHWLVLLAAILGISTILTVKKALRGWVTYKQGDISTWQFANAYVGQVLGLALLFVWVASSLAIRI